MSIRPRLYAYKLGSRTARTLRRYLDRSLMVREDGRFRFRYPHFIINWGNPRRPQSWAFPDGASLNQPEAVALAADKLKTFNALRVAGVRTPAFTQSQEKAKEWCCTAAATVIERHLTRGSEGRGIRVVTDASDIQRAPLYTKYVRRNDEYRVHVAKDKVSNEYKVLDAAHKRRRHGVPEEQINGHIRNLAGGWVFCRDDFTLPEDAKRQALNAVQALGLDFGAVDIGYTSSGKGFVFEVNTAPALEGTTLIRYLSYFKEAMTAYHVRSTTS